MMFDCHCCGRRFRSSKPQDPARDKGFGSCEDCLPLLTRDAVRHGFDLREWTAEEFRERWERYA